MKSPAWAALVLVLSIPSAVAAGEDALDSLIYDDPPLPKIKIVRVFADGLLEPWLQALQRPEADLQCHAALTITLAHKDGVQGLDAAVKPLLEVLDKRDNHRFARLAAARALVELDARQVAPQLFQEAKKGDQLMREIIEPALAKWKYRPAGEVWLKRLSERQESRSQAAEAREEDTVKNQAASKADLLLAIRGLEELREPQAISHLTELIHSVENPWSIRLEAARALGVIKTTGLEPDAQRLLPNPKSEIRNPKQIQSSKSQVQNQPESRSSKIDASDFGFVSDFGFRISNLVLPRIAAAWLLRHHQGDNAVRLLKELAGDAEPAVAAIALQRLLEIDAKLVPGPALDSALKSSDALVRALAVEVLFKEPTAERIRLLAERLNDEHPEVRSKARHFLFDLASERRAEGARGEKAGGSVQERPVGKWRDVVIQGGMKVLAAEDWRGLEQAVILLVKLDHKPAAKRLVKLLQFDRPEVFIAAAWGLRHLAVPETLPEITPQFQYVYDLAQGGWRPKTQQIFPIGAYDKQLSQLAQFIGQSGYRPAEGFLRVQVPRNRKPGDVPVIGQESRAACVWALGLFYEGKVEPKLVSQYEERLNDVPRMMDPGEFPLIRRACAIALGRMKSKESLKSLRRYYLPDGAAIDPLSLSCGWAIQEITGEPLRPPLTVTLPAETFRNFLRPLPAERKTGG